MKLSILLSLFRIICCFFMFIIFVFMTNNSASAELFKVGRSRAWRSQTSFSGILVPKYEHVRYGIERCE